VNTLGLHGSTALVTGASKRLGRAIALGLARDGANIVIHYNHSLDEAEHFRQELLSLDVNAWTVGADFSMPAEYETLIDRAFDIAGSIDILVNNASIFSTGTLTDLVFDDISRNVKVNAWVPFILAGAFSKKVETGAIINILDTRIDGIDLAHPAYSLSKKMLHEMTKMMAIEFAPDITVNAVAPGLILPPQGQDDKYLENLAGTVPLKRHGGPADVADAVLFLATCDFVTGQVLYVDGGRHLKEYDHG